MERGKIIITRNPADGLMSVRIELTKEGTVWLTNFEIAELFNVYSITVLANIKALFKSEALYMADVMRTSTVLGRDGCYVEYYNLDVIIALSFKMKSPVCRIFRKWVTEQLTRAVLKKTPAPIMIQFSNQILSASLMN